MKNKIHFGQYRIQPVSVPSNFETDPALALGKLAKEYHLHWLLAHADDGVIWGEFRADGLHLSSDVFPQVSPPLRVKTLQQARLFGQDAELLLWKNGAEWRATLAQDGQGENAEYYNESHLLWGTAVEDSRDGFVLLVEGREGLRHAPPLPSNSRLPALLQVRHYLNYDPDGQAYIALSRLVGIGHQGGEK